MMGLPVPNLHSSSVIYSANKLINDLTRKYPLVAIVCSVAFTILARNAFLAATFTGLIVGAIFAFTAFNITNHILANREDFSLLIKYSFRALKTKSFEERQQIDFYANIVRERIAGR